MATLTIKLKQHTPIIHFQSDRTYATIRATELKPKLDKFLIDKEPSLPVNEKRALDYKVRISSIGHQPYPIPDRYPLFFGDMGEHDPQRQKKFVYSNDPVNIEFFSYNSSILTVIRNNCYEFFMKTNFGMRQSKGFGSFYIESINGQANRELYPLKYHFSIKRNEAPPYLWKQLFNDISLFYNSLRAGINLPHIPFYFKSMMFLYFKAKSIRWDKRSIKEEYFKRDIPSEQRLHPDSNGPIVWDRTTSTGQYNFLVKDLLGLSTAEVWQRYDRSRPVISKEDIDGVIKRFKSPIYFKPIKMPYGYEVWFDAEIVNPLFGGKIFNIKKDNRGALQLITPVLNQPNPIFDIHDFISFAVKQNLSTHVDEIFHETTQFKTLTRIYKEISENLRGGSQ
jgi:hypothetical protein